MVVEPIIWSDSDAFSPALSRLKYITWRDYSDISPSRDHFIVLRSCVPNTFVLYRVLYFITCNAVGDILTGVGKGWMLHVLCIATRRAVWIEDHSSLVIFGLPTIGSVSVAGIGGSTESRPFVSASPWPSTNFHDFPLSEEMPRRYELVMIFPAGNFISAVAGIITNVLSPWVWNLPGSPTSYFVNKNPLSFILLNLSSMSLIISLRGGAFLRAGEYV